MSKTIEVCEVGLEAAEREAFNLFMHAREVRLGETAMYRGGAYAIVMAYLAAAEKPTQPSVAELLGKAREVLPAEFFSNGEDVAAAARAFAFAEMVRIVYSRGEIIWPDRSDEPQ